MKRFCFCCERPLAKSLSTGNEGDLFEHEFRDPLSNATSWTTRGNYGSTIIDCMPGEPTYEIYICDKCFVERQNKAYKFREVESRRPIYEVTQVNGMKLPEHYKED